MKVHLVKRQTIESYALRNARSRLPFQIWLNILKYTDWNIPEDVLTTFGSADMLGKGTNRVVFDIGGNNYRMIYRYLFGNKQVHLFVCWIGTHAEYTILCRQNKQYEVNVY